jgi:hypothetical protein
LIFLNKIIKKNNKYSLFLSGDCTCTDELCGILINSEYGRFGNNVKQLRNSLRISLMLGIYTIAMPDEIFNAWMPKFKTFNFYGYKVIRFSDFSELGAGVWLSSNFFDISAFNDHLILDDEIFFSCFFKKILNINKNKKLSIHIRSGDIFSSKPHPSYIQPPFEYYRIAIEDYLSSNIVDRVHLVCEDFKNPVSNKLIEYFSKSRINFFVNSGDLISAFNDLIGSDCAIFGFGSFAQPALFASQKLDCLYFPNYEVEGIKVAKRLGFFVKYVIIHDYIEVGDWINSDEQRKSLLMHSNCSSPIVF